MARPLAIMTKALGSTSVLQNQNCKNIHWPLWASLLGRGGFKAQSLLIPTQSVEESPLVLFFFTCRSILLAYMCVHHVCKEVE